MNSPEINEDEIDLIALIKSLWLGKKIILKLSLGFAVLGILVALSSPVVFTASSTFLPQSSQSGGSSSLSGVASLVGINLGGSISGKEIPPSIYPQITESVPYKRAILEIPLNINPSEPPFILKTYLIEKKSSFNLIESIKKYTIMLPFTILTAIKGKPKGNDKVLKSEMSVSLDEEELFKTLSDVLSLSVNAKEGFVSLSVSMGNPLICAIVAKGAQEILQKSVIDYKIKSASELLTFNQKQLDLKKIEFDSLQNKLALFKDSNLNIIDSRFENRLSGMEAEFRIVNAVYQELSKQLEQSKLQVSKDTPVFSVIQPVTIPNVRSAPKRSLMVLIYTFLGFVLGCGFVLTKGPLSQILKEIRA